MPNKTKLSIPVGNFSPYRKEKNAAVCEHEISHLNAVNIRYLLGSSNLQYSWVPHVCINIATFGLPYTTQRLLRNVKVQDWSDVFVDDDAASMIRDNRQLPPLSIAFGSSFYTLMTVSFPLHPPSLEVSSLLFWLHFNEIKLFSDPSVTNNTVMFIESTKLLPS